MCVSRQVAIIRVYCCCFLLQHVDLLWCMYFYYQRSLYSVHSHGIDLCKLEHYLLYNILASGTCTRAYTVQCHTCTCRHVHVHVQSYMCVVCVYIAQCTCTSLLVMFLFTIPIPSTHLGFIYMYLLLSPLGVCNTPACWPGALLPQGQEGHSQRCPENRQEYSLL